MNKQDLINNFIKVFDGVLPHTSAKDKKDMGSQMVNYIFDSIKTEIISGNKVNISGFGRFDTIIRPARDGKNPATGEPIIIDEHSVIKFKPAQAFKDAVN